MSYYISKTINADFDKAINDVTEKLKDVGFGVLSRIDINEKFKEKLDVDFRKYTILGACNPSFAYKALQLETKLGVLLPCNVIVQEAGAGKVEVSAVDPLVAMETTNNKELLAMASDVHKSMVKMLESLNG
jgi:uncharacterized protein (DUF302 family)